MEGEAILKYSRQHLKTIDIPEIVFSLGNFHYIFIPSHSFCPCIAILSLQTLLFSTFHCIIVVLTPSVHLMLSSPVHLQIGQRQQKTEFCSIYLYLVCQDYILHRRYTKFHFFGFLVTPPLKLSKY
jgi:hypothetical protein